MKDDTLGYGRRVRDGVPLPGLSPDAALSQLVHRVFGPLAAHRARMVLDYHGLAGHPAAPLTGIAARHHVTPRTVSARLARVRAAGARLPLTRHLIGEVSRRSTVGEDHLGRTRIAATLALPAPKPPARPAPTRTAVPAGHLAVARASARLLAAAGPLTLDDLLAAASRSRRVRQRTPLSAGDLAAVLAAAGSAPGPDGRWPPPPGVAAPARYRAVVDAAAGRDLSRQQMIAILTAAGTAPAPRPDD